MLFVISSVTCHLFTGLRLFDRFVLRSSQPIWPPSVVHLFVYRFNIRAILSVVVPRFVRREVRSIFLPNARFRIIASVVILVTVLVVGLLYHVPVVGGVFYSGSVSWFFACFSIENREGVMVQKYAPSPQFSSLSIPPVLKYNVASVSSSASGSATKTCLVGSLMVVGVFPGFFLIRCHVCFLCHVVTLAI